MKRLFELLEQIDIELEHGVSDPETIRAMKPEETFALVRFNRSLHGTARCD
jgi:hypothetical protein